LTTSRLVHRTFRAGIVIVLGLGTTFFSLLGHGPVSAAPLRSVPTVSVTVPAGGSASVQVRAVALQPGSALPQGALSLAQQPLADDRIRTTLYYGLDWGYTSTDPQQVALAVWWAQDGSWRSADHAIAERIATAASGAPGLPSWNPSGRSILSLLGQGQVSLSDLHLSPLSLSPAVGTGSLTLRNASGQELAAYLPYGTVFNGPAGSALVWAEGAAAPEPTQEPTATAAPPAPTATQPAAEPSPTTSYKGGSPPAEDATATPSYKEPPEAEPTAEPTAEPEPTATEAAVAAPTEAPAPPAADESQAKAPRTSEEAQEPVEAAPAQPAAPAAPAAPAPIKAAEKPAEAPAKPAQAPVLPTVSDPAGEKESTVPQPVGTTLLQATTIVPSPVSTGQVPPPDPELTKQATVPVKEPTETPIPTVTEPVKGAPTEPPKEAATEVPAQIQVPPVPVPVVPTETPLPVINVAPPGETVDPKGQQPLPPVAAGTDGLGAPPNNSPGTGGGPSPLPAWLALFSAVLVAGGWSLRRMASQAPATAPAPVVATPSLDDHA
jgi:hypothetical protein